VCISQFILEDGGILDPTDDKSITWWYLNAFHRRCHAIRDLKSRYFKIIMLIFFFIKNVKISFYINNQCHNISTCRSIMETICGPCAPHTVDAIQCILCIAFLHSPNNIFQQQAFCFFLHMDHKLDLRICSPLLLPCICIMHRNHRIGRIAVELLEI
jgi:hypothetical protein